MLRRSICASLLTLLVAISTAQERISDVIYQKKGGVALTLDVFKPAKPNGIGVVFVVSGGWVSDHSGINPIVSKPLTDKGITVFEVVHGSQPKYTVPEIVPMIQRSIRFIRANAATYGIDPNKIGIFGGSAGGHLSLMIAGTGDAGDPNAKDPVDRVSSAVEAVGAYFPPTDFENFGRPGLHAFDIPMLRVFNPGWGVTDQTPREKLEALEKGYSPIHFISPKFPPAYLIHGDKDPLVPYEQSTTFVDALKKAGVSATLVIVPGAGHDPRLLASPAADKLADWFVSTLSKQAG
jgi:acetyl esterase/lipase